MRIQQDRDLLVIGPEMDGHDFCAGLNTITGRKTPWNTFAIWKVNDLALTGFLLVADGFAYDRSKGGVEELSAISLLQHINPRYKAILSRMAPTKKRAENTVRSSKGGYHPKVLAVEKDTIMSQEDDSKLKIDKTSSSNSRLGFGLSRRPSSRENLRSAVMSTPDSELSTSDKQHPATTWNTSFTDKTRAKYHMEKMKSKNTRPALQMSALGIPNGFVEHIIL